jgi:alpha-L-arabinofuranosidase
MIQHKNRKFTAKLFSSLLLAVVLSACGKAGNKITSPVADTNLTGVASITIDASKEEGVISPLIMGFNTVYCYEPDQVWERGNGRIPQLLQQLNTGILRYPGGTVLTHYHWENPTGQGWVDTWDPKFDGLKNLPPSSYMDIDEYLDVCAKLKTEPLVGINLGSGKKYNRINDGIEEAKRLMMHFKKRGIKVKYYYLDNEPYHETANYTFTAAEFAGLVNLYVPEMKKIDNDIRIIVNTHPRNLDYTGTLIKQAGNHINYLDIHYYWRWGNATYDNWKKEIPMRQGTGLPYVQQRGFYRKLADSLGQPHIDLISLEWNVGQIGKNNPVPTEAQVALMAAEEFTQFIQSGMPIATFWPISWPRNTEFQTRVLLNAQEQYRTNKVFDMFRMYKNVLGQKMVNNEGATDALRVLSVKSTKGDTLWVYIMNKQPDQAAADINLQVGNFKAKKYHAEGFLASDNNPQLKIEPIKINAGKAGSYRLQVPQYSLAKVTLVINN